MEIRYDQQEQNPAPPFSVSKEDFDAVKFLQKKKTTVWFLIPFAFCNLFGMLCFVLAGLLFRDFLNLLVFLPLAVVGFIVILFGCPYPFEILEEDSYWNFSLDPFAEEQGAYFDLSFLCEDCGVTCSKQLGHFWISAFAVAPFGILTSLVVSGKLFWASFLLSFLGIFIISVTGLVYLIRYHYRRSDEEDEEDSIEMN